MFVSNFQNFSSNGALRKVFPHSGSKI